MDQEDYRQQSQQVFQQLEDTLPAEPVLLVAQGPTFASLASPYPFEPRPSLPASPRPNSRRPS